MMPVLDILRITGGSMPAWCPSFIAQFVPTMIYDAIVLRKMQC